MRHDAAAYGCARVTPVGGARFIILPPLGAAAVDDDDDDAAAAAAAAVEAAEAPLLPVAAATDGMSDFFFTSGVAKALNFVAHLSHTMSTLCVFVVLLLRLSVGEMLQRSTAANLRSLFVSSGQLPASPSTAAEIAVWRDAGMVDWPVECPRRFSWWACDANGTVAELNVTARNPADTWLESASNFFVVEPSKQLVIDGFYGFSTSIFADRLVIRNATFFGSWPSSFRFPFVARHLLLENVAIPSLDLVRSNLNVSLFAPESCSFVNVTLRCPVPPWLWRCFANATSAPPCLAFNGTLASPSGVRFDQFCFKCTTCSPVARAGFTCASNFLPDPLGKARIEQVFELPQFVWKIHVETAGVVGNVLAIELFDWATSNWTTVFEGPLPRSVAVTEDFFMARPVLTNRVRLTAELFFDREAMSFDADTFEWPRPLAWQAPPLPLVCDAIAVSFNNRSMLDETAADSWCIGRTCYDACTRYATDFTFARTVKAQFLVIQGGEVWREGVLVATPSSGTRVYKLDGNETDRVLVTGVGKPRRVRLVGDPVTGSLPAPTLPTRLGMPGVFVKTFAAAIDSGGVVVGGGVVGAPNGTVTAVRVRNVAFASTSDGRLWQAAANASWSAVSAAALTPFVPNEGESAPTRLLAAVADRLLVVVLSNTKIHDGTQQPLLVNRKLVQAALDVFDVERGVWFTNLLQHDIERNSSDVDIVQWNATAFAVVERATRAASFFAFRPFPYNLTSCAANSVCALCVSSEANEEPCRWCGGRCVSRLASCTSDETSTIEAANCPATTTAVSTTTAAATALSGGAGNATTIATTLAIPSSTAAATNASVAPQQATADPLLPLWVVLGVLVALGALLIAFVLFLRHRAAARAAAEKPAVALQEQPVFDPNARYTAMSVDENDRYGAL